MEHDHEDDAQWAFAQKREAHDVRWARGFYVALAVSAAAGSAAWASMNPKFNTIFSDSSVLGDATHCSLPEHTHATDGRSLLASTDPHFQTITFVKHVLWWLLVTMGATAGLAVAYLQLFRRAPKVAIYGSISLFCICYLTAGVGAGAVGGIIAGAFCIFIGWWVLRAQARLELVARLLAIASEGLAANPMVGPLSLGLNGAFFLAAVPFGAAMYAAMGNGDIVANSKVAQHYNGQCYAAPDAEHAHGAHVPCCTWQVATSGWAVVAVVGLVALWTRAVFAQIRTYTIAGSITQWYFFGHTRGNTMLSLRHATTSGFGSVCFAAVLITACDVLRWVAQRVRSNRYGQVVAAVFACLFSWLLEYLQEFLRAVTNFATVQMAATGEPFYASSRSVLDLLVRNGMKSFTVWWLPNFVLNLAALALAALWWLVVALASNALWSAKGSARMTGDSALAGFFSFLLAAIVLLYVGGVLKNIVDTLYICYARDLDSGAVTKQEVHEAYSQLPKPEGAVVMQPDNAVVYGALEEGRGGTRASGGARTPLLDEA